MSKILLAALMATTALPAAALTAPEVWEDWQAAVASFGMTMEAGERSYDDGVLRLSDLTTTTRVTMGGDTLVTTSEMTGEHLFTEEADGTVRYVPPQTMTVTDTTEGAGETTRMTYTISTADAAVVARDDADGARLYDMGFGSLTYAFDDISGEGPEVPPVALTMTAEGYETTHRTAPDGEAFTQESTIDVVRVDVDGAEAREPFTASLRWTDLAGTSAGRLPAMPPTDGGLTLASLAELDLKGTLTHSGGAGTIEAIGPQGPVSIQTASEAGGLDFAMGADGIDYAISSEGTSLTADVPQFPAPVTLAIAASETGFAFPIAPADAAPWSMEVALRDLTVDDAIWSLFDPTGQLPRDPATLVLAMGGEAELTTDAFGDPAASAGDAPPFRPLTANITEMLLRVAGAELAATGALTFPEAEAMGEPVGSIDLTLDGALALLDRIVALGVVPPEQATFARAMLGGLAEEVGEDRYALTLQFTPGGGVNANGMPLR